MGKSRKSLTYKVGEHPQAGPALEQALSELRKANTAFRRVIDGTLVTEAEYQDWLSRGGAQGNR